MTDSSSNKPESPEMYTIWHNKDLPLETIESLVPSIRKSIGEQIRWAREAKNLSQRDLADLLGTRQAYISDMEKGKTEPNTTMLIKLSHFLDQPVIFFVPPAHRDTSSQPKEKQEDLSVEEEELIRNMRLAYPSYTPGLILHVIQSLIDYDMKMADFLSRD